MIKVNYQGAEQLFKDIFYAYIDMREGSRNVVYADIYGNPTYGIGHKVEANEGLVPGTEVSNYQVQQAFNNDYDRLQIEPWVAELQEAGHTYNMMLAVASFVWSHGYGDYETSALRAGLLDGSLTADNIQAYLTANWDIHKPKNQQRNRKDFEVGFSTIPWTSSSFYASAKWFGNHFPRLSDWVKNNPGLATTILLIMIIALLVLIIKTKLK